MWSVKLFDEYARQLPSGFEVCEDETFVYLKKLGGEIIATFPSVGVKPTEIIEAAKRNK